MNNQVDVVELFVETFGVKVNVKDDYGKTPSDMITMYKLLNNIK